VQGTPAASFDHLVGAAEQAKRKYETERSRRRIGLPLPNLGMSEGITSQSEARSGFQAGIPEIPHEMMYR